MNCRRPRRPIIGGNGVCPQDPLSIEKMATVQMTRATSRALVRFDLTTSQQISVASEGSTTMRIRITSLLPRSTGPPYWNMVEKSRSTVVVIRDDPTNILDRAVFYDDDSRPMEKKLTPHERALCLDEIKNDMRYFARSYSKAHVSVHINGLGPVEAAKQIKAALDALYELKSLKGGSATTH
jgi:hypothetical protein